MNRRRILIFALPGLALAQIGTPPEFQSNGTFQKSGAAATVDGTSHASAERTQINAGILERLRRLPGHADGVRLIENRMLAAALELFKSQQLPIGIAAAAFLNGRPEASGAQLLALAKQHPDDLTITPFLGETVGSVPALAPQFLQTIQAAAAAHPQNAEVQYYLGRALLKQIPARNAEAIPLLRRAADLDAKDTRALLELGREYTALEKRTEAIAVLEEALRRDNTLSAAHFRLAGLYRANKQPEKSREHLQQFQKLLRPPR